MYCAIHMAAAVQSRVMNVRHGQRILYKTRAISPPRWDYWQAQNCAALRAGAACTGCWEALPELSFRLPRLTLAADGTAHELLSQYNSVCKC